MLPSRQIPQMPPEPATASPPPDDAALIAAWGQGDEGAATELVRRHAKALARFLSAAGALAGDLDDLVQDTLIRAFRSAAGFRGQCQFRTWLLTIGSNVLKDFVRSSKRRQVVPLHDEIQATGGDPHEDAVASDAARRLQQGLATLPRLQREVFLLRAQQGMEYEEIAAALNTTPGASRVHYHHAVKRLKEHLE